MAAEVEEDNLLLALGVALLGLADSRSDGVAAFGSGDYALCLRKDKTFLESLQLRDIDSLHKAVLDKLGHNHAGTVVAETAGVDVCGTEVVAQGEHRDQRGEARLVAKVIVEHTLGELGAAQRLSCDEAGILMLAGEGVAHERECQTAKVTAAAEATDNHVGIFARHLHLLLCLQTDDALVQGHMVQHRTEGVAAVGGVHGQLHSLADGGAQRTLVVGILGEDILAGAGTHRRRCDDLCAVGLHDAAAIGLLLVRYLDHIYGCLEAEHLGCIAQRGAPLAGAGLGGDIGDALFLAVVCLRQGAVELVAAHGAHALVLEIDVALGADSLFQAVGANQRGRAVRFIEVTNFLRNVDPAVGLVELLLRCLSGENMCEVVYSDGLLCAGVQHGQRLVGHVCLDVIPLSGDLFLRKDKSFSCHNCKF